MHQSPAEPLGSLALGNEVSCNGERTANLRRPHHPERIGCQLTENYQIDPEQSTSAIVCHHPDAKYFNA
jgi:5-methyltetrahydrofolate--homocysteine methyltransferase